MPATNNEFLTQSITEINRELSIHKEEATFRANQELMRHACIGWVGKGIAILKQQIPDIQTSIYSTTEYSLNVELFIHLETQHP